MMSAIICHFMTSLEQESLEIARGLKQRDPDLLDQLIERYQYRLLRYLVSLAAWHELPGLDFTSHIHSKRHARSVIGA
jgi:RNA polymerase sigma-70 factor (ECF subfamily)